MAVGSALANFLLWQVCQWTHCPWTGHTIALIFFFLSISLSSSCCSLHSFSTFLSLYHSLPSFSSNLASSQMHTRTCGRTHHHPISLWAVRERRRRSKELGLLGVCVLFFKGLSGPLVCMADRLDLIPGLIQSLSLLSPSQHVVARLECPCVYY